jgi:N-acetylmuramoyl-L-alanine amidase
VEEQRFTLDAARAVAERLEATGGFEARLSREGEDRVAYRDRVDDAERWGADVFVSLHSDVRGKSEPWEPAPADPGSRAILPGGAPFSPGMSCPRSLAAPGFSVLWSDEGEAELRDRRLGLARAVARRMGEAGLLPYGGAEYTGLYERDAAQPGVFVDRHAPDQRIYVLRRPSMPSILIETHHALDPREAERWTEPRTLDAFAAALAAALIDALADRVEPAGAGAGHRAARTPAR